MAKPEHVAEAVREEEGVRVGCDQVVGCADQNAGVDEALSDGLRGLEVELLVFDSRPQRVDGRSLRGQNHVVEVALEWCERRGDREGAGDVARVAVNLRAGVDQDELAVVEYAIARRSMQDRRVGPAADDRAVGGALPAEAEELGLQLDLDGSLGQPGAGDSPGAQVALDGGVDSAAHVREFERVLGTPTLGERLADALGRVFVDHHFKRRPIVDAVLGAALLDVAVAEQGQRATAARVEPRAER